MLLFGQNKNKIAHKSSWRGSCGWAHYLWQKYCLGVILYRRTETPWQTQWTPSESDSHLQQKRWVSQRIKSWRSQLPRHNIRYTGCFSTFLPTRLVIRSRERSSLSYSPATVCVFVCASVWANHFPVVPRSGVAARRRQWPPTSNELLKDKQNHALSAYTQNIRHSTIPFFHFCSSWHEFSKDLLTACSVDPFTFQQSLL